MAATAQTTSAKKSTKKNGKGKSTALATTSKETAIVQGGDFDYGEDSNEGFEGQTSDDLLVPRLIILQTNSPQVLPVDAGGVEGAKAGMLYCKATGELMKSCRFVAAFSEKCFNEWITRDAGSGFVARHELGDPFVVQKLKETPRGKILFEGEDGKEHQLVETQYLYIMPLDDNNNPSGGYYLLDFVSTKLSIWKNWNTKVRTFTMPMPEDQGGGRTRVPLYSHTVVITTEMQKNDQGRWFNAKLQPAGEDIKSSLLPRGGVAYMAAKDLRELVKSGALKPEVTEDQGGDGGGGKQDPAKGKF